MEKSPSSCYTVRFGDCDPFGHLNNARYVDYFLNAREDHLKNAYAMDLKDFYQQGLTWFVGGHEIQYLKPADYNETVRIETTLVKASPDLLLVEMVMTDQQQSHIKAVLWTRFIPVNIKTGKRENHTEDFMAFAKSVEMEIPSMTFQDRIRSLMLQLKESQN
jgi:acyl-CoA thioester hydrolase